MNTVVRIVFMGLSILFSLQVTAQEKIEGIVFDKDTKQRLAKVVISNTSNGTKMISNLKGEFGLMVHKDNKIVFQKDNYHNDTLQYAGGKVVIIYLKRTAILIDPVTVVARRSPDDILSQRKRDYTKAYRLADPGSLISVGDNGAGLSIGAVYNYFSKEGRNARRLTKYFEQEYQDNIIDLRFSNELIKNVTGLEGEPLENFRIRYRPSYDFVQVANHYEMVHYIKIKYENFKHVPYIKPLPNLKEIVIDSKE